jgi:hypothetical protein
MSTQSSQSKYQEVNKRRTKKLRDTRRKFEIQRERATTAARRSFSGYKRSKGGGEELQRECFDLEH